jgi:hypothetical protein
MAKSVEKTREKCVFRPVRTVSSPALRAIRLLGVLSGCHLAIVAIVTIDARCKLSKDNALGQHARSAGGAIPSVLASLNGSRELY